MVSPNVVLVNFETSVNNAYFSCFMNNNRSKVTFPGMLTVMCVTSSNGSWDKHLNEQSFLIFSCFLYHSFSTSPTLVFMKSKNFPHFFFFYMFLHIKHTNTHQQINELSHVNIPVMLLPDHFRANSKIKVDYHLFNK